MTDTVNVKREVLERLVAWINREVPVPTRSATRWAMDITDLLAAAPKAEPVSATDDLIDGFAAALKSKLNKAAEKYGYNDDWMRPEWREDLVRHLIAHVEKGDPRDVAAYCAFAWHHGWSVKPEAPKVEQSARFQSAKEGVSDILSEVAFLDADGVDCLATDIMEVVSEHYLAEAPKVEQEPVGKIDYSHQDGLRWIYRGKPPADGTLLYTHPAPASDELLGALEALLKTAGREGSRKLLGDGCEDDQWVDYMEVGKIELDRLQLLVDQHKGPQP